MTWLILKIVWAQPPSNEAVVQQLHAQIQTDSSMQIADLPLINYQFLPSKTYIRRISCNYFAKKEPSTQLFVAFQDTLEATQIRQVRNSSSRKYKGENPLPSANIWMPLAGITTGIAVVLTLFYLRS